MVPQQNQYIFTFLKNWARYWIMSISSYLCYQDYVDFHIPRVEYSTHLAFKYNDQSSHHPHKTHDTPIIYLLVVTDPSHEYWLVELLKMEVGSLQSDARATSLAGNVGAMISWYKPSVQTQSLNLQLLLYSNNCYTINCLNWLKCNIHICINN